MIKPRSTAAHASIVFLRIREFSRRPVAERARLKAQLDDAVAIGSAALKEREEDRIFLDAPDGTAVVVLGNPRGALEFANQSLAAANDIAFAIGINYGPVRVVQGDGTGKILVGDGISVASKVAEFASPGRVLATRSFRDFLVRLAPDRGRCLSPAGTFRDPQDPARELFFADPQAFAESRRRFLVLAALGAAGIVGLGIVARYTIQSLRPAVIELDIKPQGDVFVDGVMKGSVPPLARLELTPGKHSIEIGNPRFKSLVVEVDVKAGEHLTIRHSFTAPSSQKPAKRGFFDWFKR